VGTFLHDESARHAWCKQIWSIIKQPPTRRSRSRSR
jgi:hypothetical protein